MEWSGWSCTFGWPVLGIWPKQEVGDNGLAIPSAEPVCVHRAPSGKYIAVGCTNGEVRIYNYPCVSRDVS